MLIVRIDKIKAFVTDNKRHSTGFFEPHIFCDDETFILYHNVSELRGITIYQIFYH